MSHHLVFHSIFHKIIKLVLIILDFGCTCNNVVPAGCLVNSLPFLAIVVVGLTVQIGCVVGLAVGDAVIQLSFR